MPVPNKFIFNGNIFRRNEDASLEKVATTVENTCGTIVIDTYAYIPAKTATIANFNFNKGSIINAKFTNGNSAENCTLNINNIGAKAIHYNGAPVPPYMIKTNDEVAMVYNGICFDIVNFDDYGDLDNDYSNL